MANVRGPMAHTAHTASGRHVEDGPVVEIGILPSCGTVVDMAWLKSPRNWPDKTRKMMGT